MAEPDVYGLAWQLLGRRIAKSRRQTITKTELIEWRLKELENAVDILVFKRQGDVK